MMLSVSSYVRRGRTTLHQWMLDPKVHRGVRYLIRFWAGFFAGAASLGNFCQPVCLGLILASSGATSVLLALGSICGYALFWDSAGLQGILWTVLALPCALVLGERPVVKRVKLLLPSIGTLIVSASGVAFQLLLADDTPVPMFLLRVVLGGATAYLFQKLREGKDPMARWVGCGFGVLALSQVSLFRFLGLGYLAAGALAVGAAFPAAALAGLALDLAQITKLPMTAVLCGAWLVRTVELKPGWLRAFAPAGACLIGAWLTGVWELSALPGLLLGGAVGLYLPSGQKIAHRRGETGLAQVRLELTAGVFSQMEQLLLEAGEPPLDEAALVMKAAERACGNCANRKNCADRDIVSQMPPLILHRPLLNQQDLPVKCKKSGRLLTEVHRSQEQLRALKAGRERQRECREAVVQQYQFLSDYLMNLSDDLATRGNASVQRFTPEVAVYANRRQEDNGDRCLWFPGTNNRYYMLLCDGMGTGLGAVDEGKTAAALLKKLLSAGFPPQYALRSLNSLCILRGRSGAVTVDLAAVQLDTGKATLYKWGAAPSYLLFGSGGERLGNPGPPPGLSLDGQQEAATPFTMRRGQWLVMASDGVAGEEILTRWGAQMELTPGELAQQVLSGFPDSRTDDATIAMLRLNRIQREE